MITVKYHEQAPSAPNNKKWLVFKRPYLRYHERICVSCTGTIFLSEMLNTYEETFEVTEMRTFKHEPFFIVGGRGVGGGGGERIRGTLRYLSKHANISRMQHACM